MDAIERRGRTKRRNDITIMDYFLGDRCVTASMLKLQDAGELILCVEFTRFAAINGQTLPWVVFADHESFTLIDDMRNHRVQTK